MPAKNLTRINDEATYCHIYNTGIEKRAIFCDGEDYQVFLGYLKDYLTPQDPNSLKKTFQIHGRTFQGIPHLPKNYLNQVELIAYNLMSDRFHLLLRQLTKGSLEKFLRSLCTRYSMYFNKKYHRSGALFAGPYKSVQIKDELQLPQLTGFFHHSGKNSSYPEYLGSRKTSWVKPEIVLSSFGKGTAGYQDFVEKYQPDQKEKEPVKTDQMESRLERSQEETNLASEPDLPTEQNLKVHSKMPQFLAISTMGFVFLVSFSLWNINTSKASTNSPSPVPAVLSETKETTSPVTTSESTPEATATAVIKAEALPEASPETKTILIVKINDGSSTVNIRQQPAINSEKVGQANDGDTFKFISLNAGWYEIKLSDGSKGFISAKYAMKKEANH